MWCPLIFLGNLISYFSCFVLKSVILYTLVICCRNCWMIKQRKRWFFQVLDDLRVFPLQCEVFFSSFNLRLECFQLSFFAAHFQKQRRCYGRVSRFKAEGKGNLKVRKTSELWNPRNESSIYQLSFYFPKLIQEKPTT